MIHPDLTLSSTREPPHKLVDMNPQNDVHQRSLIKTYTQMCGLEGTPKGQPHLFGVPCKRHTNVCPCLGPFQDVKSPTHAKLRVVPVAEARSMGEFDQRLMNGQPKGCGVPILTHKPNPLRGFLAKGSEGSLPVDTQTACEHTSVGVSFFEGTSF